MNRFNFLQSAFQKFLGLKRILLFCLYLFNHSTMQAQDFAWAKSMGSSENEIGRILCIDSLGNVYMTGFFSGTVDFDPGAGVANLTSAGDQDIFISKFDASGNYIWAKSIGGTSQDNGNAIAVDTLGNIYVTGNFWLYSRF